MNMQKRKILSITAQKPHSTGSGIYLTEIIKNWHVEGHLLSVVAGVYEEDCVVFPEGVSFYPVTYHTDSLPFAITGMSDEMPYESIRYRELTAEQLDKFQNRFHEVIQKAVEEQKPDLIVCHHLYLLTALVRKWYPHQKVIACSHGSDLRQICKNPLKREEIKEQIRKLDGVIALHETHKDEIRRVYGVPKERIVVGGIGFNQTIFYDDTNAGISLSADRPYRIIFAGKVTEKKGIFSLLRALEYLPYEPDQCLLEIAGGPGSDNEFAQIQKLAKKSNYPVRFLGVLSQEELAQHFRASDLFVLPSFFEGLPLVVVEAMACGCQAVCSDLNGIAPWFQKHVPNAEIEFVKLPAMKDTDEPAPEELPAFEKRLARAIDTMLRQKGQHRQHPDFDNISWGGISKKILETAEFEFLIRKH